MTITEEKIQEFCDLFWKTDSKLGGRAKIRLEQWDFELLETSSEDYSSENEACEFISKREGAIENSACCIILSGKDIYNLDKSLRFSMAGVKRKAYKIEPHDVFYVVAFVSNKKINN